MLLDTFNYCSSSYRCSALWQKGKHICSVVTNGKRYSLYKLFEYFVEVQVFDNTKDLNPVAFDNGERLNKYKDCVELIELVELKM